MSTRVRCYSELKRLETFEERFDYLKLAGTVGYETFGFDRYLNQDFYRSKIWKDCRRFVIARDVGCDLGIEGRDIGYKLIIHHMNPIMKEDILNQTDYLIDPEYLICASPETHRAIHYGDKGLLVLDPIVRVPNDTCLWTPVKRERSDYLT